MSARKGYPYEVPPMLRGDGTKPPLSATADAILSHSCPHGCCAALHALRSKRNASERRRRKSKRGPTRVQSTAAALQVSWNRTGPLEPPLIG